MEFCWFDTLFPTDNAYGISFEASEWNETRAWTLPMTQSPLPSREQSHSVTTYAKPNSIHCNTHELKQLKR
ncbi:hypothetical protein VTN49DRAFT_3383 [Thermomyces lanuginosus]|uniref:uncharacterized protein n=1 Tax=Thermomyces lanuginosus TaxID=5541 RepID=UPI003743E658